MEAKCFCRRISINAVKFFRRLAAAAAAAASRHRENVLFTFFSPGKKLPLIILSLNRILHNNWPIILNGFVI